MKANLPTKRSTLNQIKYESVHSARLSTVPLTDLEASRIWSQRFAFRIFGILSLFNNIYKKNIVYVNNFFVIKNIIFNFLLLKYHYRRKREFD
jgi:hypothetical protein